MNFWSKFSFIYDNFLKKDKSKYKELSKLIVPLVKDKTVLEVAMGTGLITENVCKNASKYEATDYSEEMVIEAKKKTYEGNINFSVQNMFDLPFEDNSFDVIIASNVLHIIENPELAIKELKRVLKDDGTLIVPTFTHKDNSLTQNFKSRFMKIMGFKLYHSWSKESFIKFLKSNKLSVGKNAVFDMSFPLTYCECKKI